jgi:uncharacterized protein (TIGR02246 family)
MLRIELLVTASALGIAFSGAAAAEDARAESCRRGEDVRLIEVLTPGDVGAACDVRVTRDGGARVNTPYHANADKNFCRAMAAELASELTLEGFECSPALSGSIEAALAGGAVQPAPPGETAALTELPLNQQAEQLGLGGAPAAGAPPPAQTPALTMAPIDDTAPAPAIDPAPARIAETAPSLEGVVAETGEAPETPVVLTAGAQPASVRAPRPARNGAGRLVGAQPSLEDIIDVSVDASKSAAAPQLASVGALAPRSTTNIVSSVMAANAAAWNEGNLAAFLGAYDASGDVRLVVDGAVAAGFNSVRAHYEALVASGGAMGRLAFSDLDVTMTAADVATVAGRYSHESGLKKSAGAMTVVLKQIDGRWRIVQESRVADVPPPTLAPVN